MGVQGQVHADEGKSKRAVAYIRVSTKQQDERVQMGALERFAEQHGYEILKYFVDKGESGLKSYKNRPAAQQLINFLETGGKDFINAVLVFDITRLGRDMLDTLEFFLKIEKEYGVPIISINDSWTWNPDNPDKKFFLAVFAWVAEKEWALRRERVEAAWAMGKQKGRPRVVDAKTVLKYIRKYPGFDLKAITKLMNLDGIKVSYTTVRRRVKELIQQGLLTREELRGRGNEQGA